jgi:hypothetical protein
MPNSLYDYCTVNLFRINSIPDSPPIGFQGLRLEPDLRSKVLQFEMKGCQRRDSNLRFPATLFVSRK